jgi:hypothetical protein
MTLTIADNGSTACKSAANVPHPDVLLGESDNDAGVSSNARYLHEGPHLPESSGEDLDHSKNGMSRLLMTIKCVWVTPSILPIFVAQERERPLVCLLERNRIHILSKI